MQKKILTWSIVGVLITVVIGGVVWYYLKQAAIEMNPQPTMTTGADTVSGTSDTSLATSKEIAVESSTASIDDITKSISDDLQSDESALVDEEADETARVTESGILVQNLGQSYDESQY